MLHDFRHGVAVERRLQVDAFLHHHGDFAVVEILAVLDGVDAGHDAVAQTFAAERVAGHAVLVAMSFVDDGLDFGKGERRDRRTIRR